MTKFRIPVNSINFAMFSEFLVTVMTHIGMRVTERTRLMLRLFLTGGHWALLRPFPYSCDDFITVGGWRQSSKNIPHLMNRTRVKGEEFHSPVS